MHVTASQRTVFKGLSQPLPIPKHTIYLISAFLLKTAKLKKSSKILTEYNKPGGYKQAAEDFYYLGPKVKVDRTVNLQLYESAQRSKYASATIIPTQHSNANLVRFDWSRQTESDKSPEPEFWNHFLGGDC